MTRQRPLLTALMLVLGIVFTVPALSIALKMPDSLIGKSFKDALLLSEAGDANAQTSLGMMYFFGEDVTKDTAEAVKWFRKAAEQDHAKAQGALGVLYYLGEGVAQNSKEAVKWLRKAAEQGHTEAQIILGDISFEDGYILEATEWYRKASQQGSAEAQVRLGVMYTTGEVILKNQSEAVKWYRKSAEQGNTKAQALLASAYENGEGVTQNSEQAYIWYYISVVNGFKDAVKRRDSVATHLRAKGRLAQAKEKAAKLYDQLNK